MLLAGFIIMIISHSKRNKVKRVPRRYVFSLFHTHTHTCEEDMYKSLVQLFSIYLNSGKERRAQMRWQFAIYPLKTRCVLAYILIHIERHGHLALFNEREFSSSSFSNNIWLLICVCVQFTGGE